MVWRIMTTANVDGRSVSLRMTQNDHIMSPLWRDQLYSSLYKMTTKPISVELPMYEPDQDFSFWVHLNDSLQLFAFSDKVNEDVCISVESALMAGWTYQLVGPTVTIPKHNGLDAKSLKIHVLAILLSSLPKQTTLVFADAMDVLYQQPASDFLKYLMKYTKYDDGYIIFSSEKNCWPFNRSNKKTYHCPLMQGLQWKANTNEPALGCKLEESRYNSVKDRKTFNLNQSKEWIEEKSIYLNSGLSVGIVSNYSKVISKSNEMINSLPSLCIDDQGLLAWQMVHSDNPPITLDYSSYIFASLNNREFYFDENDGLLKLWKYENHQNIGNQIDNMTLEMITIPFMIHFNGNGKAENAFNKTRDKVINWKRNKYGDKFTQDLLLKNGNFYVDGIRKKYEDVCSKHMIRWSR